MRFLIFFLALLLELQNTQLNAFSISQRRGRPSTAEPGFFRTKRAPISLLPSSSRSSGRLQGSFGNESNGDSDKRTEQISDAEAASISSDATPLEQNDGRESLVPSYKRLLLFTATTILIWISEPLLSLVDTTVVGLTQKNAVVQVAALGPATTLIDSLQYLTYFLAMATTSQLAKFLALKDYRKLQETTSQILGVAAVLGTLISAILFGFGRPLLNTMIASSQSPELIGLATKYCWIRATVAPLAVMGMVAESSCLANVDTKTPATAVFTASIVNVIGDLSLAFLGIQGAAIATAVATATSTGIMLRKVKRRKDVWRDKEYATASAGLTRMVSGTPTIKMDYTVEGENSTSTSLASTVATEVPFLSLPGRASFLELLKLSGPMFFVMLGKIACYGAMSIRATDFGVVNLAAHSIMMRIFFFFTCWGDSLSQATQSFLPRALYPKPVKKDIRKIMKRLVIFSSCVGSFIFLASRFILTKCGGYLTNDATVVAAIAKYSKLASLSLLLHPFILLSEGSMIATRDFRYLITSYSITMAMHFGLLLSACSSFADIWRVFFTFQAVRLALFGVRAISNVFNRSSDQEVSEAAAAAA